jgi:hypothetical protein
VEVMKVTVMPVCVATNGSSKIARHITAESRLCHGPVPGLFLVIHETYCKTKHYSFPLAKFPLETRLLPTVARTYSWG